MFWRHPGIEFWCHVCSQIIKTKTMESVLPLGGPNDEKVTNMVPKLTPLILRDPAWNGGAPGEPKSIKIYQNSYIFPIPSKSRKSEPRVTKSLSKWYPKPSPRHLKVNLLLRTGVPQGSQNPLKSIKIPTSFRYPQNQEKVSPGSPKASQNDTRSLPRDT